MSSEIPFEQMSRAQRAAFLDQRWKEMEVLATQEVELQRREEEEAEWRQGDVRKRGGV